MQNIRYNVINKSHNYEPNVAGEKWLNLFNLLLENNNNQPSL